MQSTLLIIAKAFFDICLLRKRPQDLPASGTFLFLCLVVYTLASFTLALPGQEPSYALLAGSLDTFLMVLICYVILKIRNYAQRWLQTCTALAGTGTIFNILALPLFYWSASLTDSSSYNPDLYLLLIILIVWNIAVLAHILRHALSVSYPLSVMVSLCYVWIMTSMSGVLLPLQELQ